MLLALTLVGWCTGPCSSCGSAQGGGCRPGVGCATSTRRSPGRPLAHLLHMARTPSQAALIRCPSQAPCSSWSCYTSCKTPELCC